MENKNKQPIGVWTKRKARWDAWRKLEAEKKLQKNLAEAIDNAKATS